MKSLHHHAKQEEPVFYPRGAEVKRETSQNRRISTNTSAVITTEAKDDKVPGTLAADFEG